MESSFNYYKSNFKTYILQSPELMRCIKRALDVLKQISCFPMNA